MHRIPISFKLWFSFHSTGHFNVILSGMEIKFFFRRVPRNVKKWNYHFMGTISPEISAQPLLWLCSRPTGAAAVAGGGVHGSSAVNADVDSARTRRMMTWSLSQLSLQMPPAEKMLQWHWPPSVTPLTRKWQSQFQSFPPWLSGRPHWCRTMRTSTWASLLQCHAKGLTGREQSPADERTVEGRDTIISRI